MTYSTHWGLVILTAIINFFLGWAWYSKLFSKAWMGEMGMSGNMDEMKAKSSQTKGMVINFVGAVLLAFVYFWLAFFLGLNTLPALVILAFMVWLGFMAPILVGAVLWEGKTWRLFWINSGFWFASLFIASIIYKLWG